MAAQHSRGFRCVVPDARLSSALRRLCRMCDEPVAMTPRTGRLTRSCAVQRKHNLPPARPAVAAVPLVEYARAASEHNAAFVARQLQHTIQPPRQLSPAPAAAADAHAARAAAERRVAGELQAAYAQDFIPTVVGLCTRGYSRQAMREQARPACSAHAQAPQRLPVT